MKARERSAPETPSARNASKTMSCEPPTFGPDADVVWIESDTLLPAPAEMTRLLTIGEFAKKFSITPRALRFYEGKGLIAPIRDGAVRLYGQSDVERLALILKARKLGFTLGEIRQMIEAQNGRPAKSLNLSRDKCMQQIGMLERQRQEIEDALAELRRIHARLTNPAGRR